jgi:CDP-glycerol glycerophosphotransferase (TagB/SpsB family)
MFGFAGTDKIFLIIGAHLQGAYVPDTARAIEDEFRKVLSIVADTIGGNITVIFKIHPNLTMEAQRALVDGKALGRIHFLKNELTVYELIGAADAVLTFGSSAVSAALATDIPVYAYKPKEYSQAFDLMHQGLDSIEKLYSPGQLESALRIFSEGSGLPDPVLRRADRDKTGIFDGKNTERFAQLINEVSYSHEKES